MICRIYTVKGTKSRKQIINEAIPTEKCGLGTFSVYNNQICRNRTILQQLSDSYSLEAILK